VQVSVGAVRGYEVLITALKEGRNILGVLIRRTIEAAKHCLGGCGLHRKLVLGFVPAREFALVASCAAVGTHVVGNAA
jgi:hypothetical protein